MTTFCPGAGRKGHSPGGAGLVSTARDYGRFLEMIRGGGTLNGVRILSPRAVALMDINQVGTLHDHASRSCLTIMPHDHADGAAAAQYHVREKFPLLVYQTLLDARRLK